MEDNDDVALTRLFTKVGRVQFILLSMIVTGFIFLGKSFISLWAGSEYNEAYYITLLLIVPETIPFIQNLGIEIQRAKNMHRARSIVYLCIAIGNVLLSIPLIKIWGPSGAALGTAISLILGNCLFMNYYYYKKIGLDIIYFWKQILKFAPAFIAPVALGIYIFNWWNMTTFSRFLAAGCCYLAGFVISMWFLGMNENEKRMVLGPLQKILRRAKKG